MRNKSILMRILMLFLVIGITAGLVSCENDKSDDNSSDSASIGSVPSNPSNISAGSNLVSSKVRISWDKPQILPDQVRTNGEKLTYADIGYIVYYVKKDGSKVRTVNEIKNDANTVKSSIIKPMTYEYHFENLENSVATYEVIVVSVLYLDQSKESTGSILTNGFTTVEDLSAAPGAPTIATSQVTATSVRVTITPPTVKGKGTDGSNLNNSDIAYELNYLAYDGNTITKENLLSGILAAQSNIKNAGTISREKGSASLVFDVISLNSETKYHFGAVAINGENVSKVSDMSVIRNVTTTASSSRATAPGVPTIAIDTTYTTTSNGIRVTITPPTVKGKGTDGTTDLTNNQIAYRVYYAKSDDAVTAEKIYSLGLVSTDRKAAGVLSISMDTDPPKALVLNLDVSSRYYFTAISVNGIDLKKTSNVGNIVYKDVEDKSTSPGKPTLTENSKTGNSIVVSVNAPVANKGKDTFGVNLRDNQISYVIYYIASNNPSILTKDKAKEEAMKNNTLVKVARAQNVTLSSLNRNTQYVIVAESVNKTNISRISDLTNKLVIRTVDSLSAAPGVPTLGTPVNNTANSGLLTMAITPPTVKGTDQDGNALTNAQIRYRIYYHEYTDLPTKSKLINDATTQSNLKDGGIKETTNGASTFRLEGLKPGTKYYVLAKSVNSTDVAYSSGASSIVNGTTAAFRIYMNARSSELDDEVVGINTNEDIGVLTNYPNATVTLRFITSERNRLKKETNLDASISRNTLTISGKSNKSNVRDSKITNYSYGLIQATVTPSGLTRPIGFSLNIRTDVHQLTGKPADYFYPLNAIYLFVRIGEEAIRQKADSTDTADLNYFDISRLLSLQQVFAGKGGAHGDINDEVGAVDGTRRFSTNFYHNYFTIANNRSIYGVTLAEVEAIIERNNTWSPDISNWNTSNIRHLDGTFASTERFNSDITSWNVSKVTRMNSTFYQAESFNRDISGWDTSRLEIMSYAFHGANSFDADITSWDFSKLGDGNGESKFVVDSRFYPTLGAAPDSKTKKSKVPYDRAAAHVFGKDSIFSHSFAGVDFCNVLDITFATKGSVIEANKSTRYPNFKGSSSCSTR